MQRPGDRPRERAASGSGPWRPITLHTRCATIAPMSSPPPSNEPVHLYAPGSPERARLRRTVHEMQATAPHTVPLHIGGRTGRRSRGPDLRRRAAPALADHGRGVDGDHRRRPGARSTPRWPPTTTGRPRPGKPGRRCSCAPRTCSAVRSATGSTPPRSSGRARASIRPRSTRRASSSTSGAGTCTTASSSRRCSRCRRRGSGTAWSTAPLEGFVLAISPFNFTSIGGNLAGAPAIVGNTVVWKPATTALLAAQVIMEIFEAAGMPPGVINMIAGPGAAVSEAAVKHPSLAGIHFTGSTDTFQHLWTTVAANLGELQDLPAAGRRDRRQGLRARASVGVDGRAARRAAARVVRVPGPEVLGGVARVHPPVGVGPASRAAGRRDRGDSGRRSRGVQHLHGRGHRRAELPQARGRPERGAHRLPTSTLVAGGECDWEVGWFVHPTIYASSNPQPRSAPSASSSARSSPCYPYPDSRLALGARPRRPHLALRAHRRDLRRRPAAIDEASTHLRYAAGNFYINDKPTGAVVGQQPFGGARMSGTNDKAGLGAEHAALGVAAGDQGDLRPAHRVALPAPGSRLTTSSD